ncbi:hypothetical protein TSUD_20870 [Trifolium subterraneum]|uniref:Uncharacterized protein n=1 Tax=Trifolium subterraneum TaxID=3900 RepID=A0A2Z6MLE7_TRISU|nr:hypothetical protein TSUD_20870 [Trifolium subterraneum]
MLASQLRLSHSPATLFSLAIVHPSVSSSPSSFFLSHQIPHLAFHHFHRASLSSPSLSNRAPLVFHNSLK